MTIRNFFRSLLGHFAAINPLTGEKKREVPLTHLPGSARMLAISGGLLFTGKWTGITNTFEGRQYVTIASGPGDELATRNASKQVPTGGSVWTFRLLPE